MAGVAADLKAASDGVMWSTAAAGNLFQIAIALGKKENLYAFTVGVYLLTYLSG